MKELVLAVRALTAQLERLSAGTVPAPAATESAPITAAPEVAQPADLPPQETPVKRTKTTAKPAVKYTFDQVKNTLLDCSARFGLDVARELLSKVGCDRVKSLSEADYPVLMGHIDKYVADYAAQNPEVPATEKDE